MFQLSRDEAERLVRLLVNYQELVDILLQRINGVRMCAGCLRVEMTGKKLYCATCKEVREREDSKITTNRARRRKLADARKLAAVLKRSA